MTTLQDSRIVKTTHCYNPLSGIQFNVTKVDRSKFKQIERCIHGDGDKKHIRFRSKLTPSNISIDTSNHLSRKIRPLKTPPPLKEPDRFLGKNINSEKTNPPVITYTITKPSHSADEKLDISSSTGDSKNLRQVISRTDNTTSGANVNYVDISLQPNESSTLANIQKDFSCRVIPSISHDDIHEEKKDFECQVDFPFSSSQQQSSSESINSLGSITCNVISTVIISSNRTSEAIPTNEQLPEQSPGEINEINEINGINKEIEGLPNQVNETQIEGNGNISTNWAIEGLNRWPP